MPLALVLFLIGLLIWKKIRTGEPWRTQDRWLMLGLLTAGMLIKGPIVYAFLLPGILIFQVIRGRPAFADGLRRGEHGRLYTAWCGWWPWLASLTIFLIWVIAGWLWVPRFYELVIVREFLARFGEVGTHVHRAQSFFFYLPHLLHKFLPWSVLMIGLAIVDLCVRRKLDGFKPSSLQSEDHQTRISQETLWLICWSFGGLIVMSLIPSKRVDRIFAVIPPLCLLLAAQVAPRNSCSHGPVDYASRSVGSAETGHRPVVTKDTLTPIYRWSTGALVLAILFTGGYTGWKVITGYRDHRNALAIFGRNVRHEAEVRHWRYEIVSAKDEGLLLYLRKTHFVEPADAV